MDSIETGTVYSNEAYLDDKMTFSGPVPQPLNKQQFLDLMEKVHQGVPNWNFNRHDVRVEGQKVIIPVQVSGTQSRTLPGLMPGMPDFPASNRSFRVPPEVVQITFRGEKVIDIHVDPVPGGGIPGMLEQIGVPVPVTGKSDSSRPKEK